MRDGATRLPLKSSYGDCCRHMSMRCRGKRSAGALCQHKGGGGGRNKCTGRRKFVILIQDDTMEFLLDYAFRSHPHRRLM